MRLLTALTFLCSLIFCPLALAGITVSPMVLRLSPGEITGDITVTNQDKTHIAYVSIEPKVEQPKKSLNPKELGYLIAPSKLAIPPASSRLVRVRLTQPPNNKERRYEIMVRPVEGDLVFAKTGQQKIRAGIRVIVAYGVILIVPPINPQAKMTLIRHDQELTAFNEGNVTVELTNGQQCKDPHSCQKLPNYHIGPGEKKTIKLLSDIPVTFTQHFASTFSEIHSN